MRRDPVESAGNTESPGRVEGDGAPFASGGEESAVGAEPCQRAEAPGEASAPEELVPEGLAPGQASEGDPVAELRAQLEAAQAQAEDYLRLLQRVQADFENFRRRSRIDRERLQEAVTEEVLGRFLPVLDHLEMAVEAAERAGETGPLREGVELTLRQFRELLAKEGLEPIPTVGHPFDPAVHEAMLQVEARDHPEGTVVQDLRKGYSFRGRPLRPAMVAVARAPAAAPGPEAPDAEGGSEGA